MLVACPGKSGCHGVKVRGMKKNTVLFFELPFYHSDYVLLCKLYFSSTTMVPVPFIMCLDLGVDLLTQLGVMLTGVLW